MWWLNIIPKSRQHGITTFICILFLDDCLWTNGVDAGIIAHTLDDVKKIFRTKIRYAYECLPKVIKNHIPARNESANALIFENDSSIYVGTSMRSGTLQRLLVSEYGKICAKYPEKAIEIQSGALNTIHEGALTFIESTTEGRGNDFHRRVEEAQRLEASGTELSRLDWKLFFFPWWQDKKNAIDPTGVLITDEYKKYFKELKEEHGVKLTPGQKAWYVKKAKDQGDLMFREQPSTLEEAFYASQKGTFFGSQMNTARKQGRIRKFIPVVPQLPMHTAWDLGKNDENAIWWFQQHRNEIRFLFYYENVDLGLDHYYQYLKDLAEKHKFFYGEHYLPHDVEVSDLTQKAGETRLSMLEDMGMRDIIVVERIPQKIDGIEAARKFLSECWFSEKGCDKGIIHLENYKKKLDERTGSFLDIPEHDAASNAADAFMQPAQEFNYERAYNRPKKKPRNRNWKVA